MTIQVIQEETSERMTRYKATIEEFWALPESMQHIEYINGEIIMAPTPTVAHQAVLRNLFRELDRHVMKTATGSIFFSPLDVVLPSGDVVQPGTSSSLTRKSRSELEEKSVSRGRRPYLSKYSRPAQSSMTR